MKRAITLLWAAMSLATQATASPLSAFINNQNCDQEIDKRFYQICYDYRAKGARFVGYLLDSSKVDAANIKKRPRFYPEKSVPERYRTYPSDYTRNEWHADRGHLAPAADFDWSHSSLKAVYSMANIVPQYYRINRKTWQKAERYERRVARKLRKVWVLNGVEYGDYTRRMRKSGIAVPVAFWKMLWNDQAGFKRCLYYRNKPISKPDAKRDRLRNHVIDCRKLVHKPRH